MTKELKKIKAIVSEILYATIATVDINGTPWNTPVFCAYDERFNFYWSSHPQSQHSRNIVDQSNVFLVIYNSQARADAGIGVYIKAKAFTVTSEQETRRALGLLGKRRGKPFNHIHKFIDEGPQRIYQAVPQQVWINDAQEDTEGDFIKDYRIEISLDDLVKK